MKTIDLNNLSEKEVCLLQTISKKLTKEYEQLVKNIYLSSDKSIDWMVNSLLSRDNYLSNVFRDICHIIFIKEIIEKEKINLVICASKSQKNVLRNYYKSKSIKTKFVSNDSLVNNIKTYFRPFLLFYINIKIIFSFIINSDRKRFNSFKNQKNITLIDTFFIDSMFKGDTFDNRYYGNLINDIPINKRKNHYFFPTILITKNLKEKIRIAKDAKEQFIYIFDVLKLKHYLFALISPFRIKKINLNNFSIRKIKIGPILKDDFRKNMSNKGSFFGILNYLFFKKLKKDQVHLRKVINWFENQIIDRGFNLGKNNFFPEIPSIGYQGFSDYHDYHLHFIPTIHEVETGQSPNKLALISKKIASQIKVDHPYIDFIISPAFRFDYLYKEQLESYEKTKKDLNVLLILPSSNTESSKLIDLLKENIDYPDFKNIKWYIKPHPNRDINLIKKNISNWSDKLKIINTSFNLAINNSDLMIGNTSSTCLEALAKGKPVIISCNNNFVDQNPIPNEYPKKFWSICNTSKEFRLALKSLILNKNYKKNENTNSFAKNVLADFFEPVSEKSLNSFLNY